MPGLVQRGGDSDSESDSDENDSIESWEVLEDEDVTGMMITAHKDLAEVGFGLQELGDNAGNPEPIDPMHEADLVLSHKRTSQGRVVEVKWGTGETTEVD